MACANNQSDLHSIKAIITEIKKNNHHNQSVLDTAKAVLFENDTDFKLKKKLSDKAY